MLENFGFSEIFLIVVVVLVLFGPKRIPDIMQSFGKGVREFKRAMHDVQDEVNKAMDERPDQRPASQKQIHDSAPPQEVTPGAGEHITGKS